MVLVWQSCEVVNILEESPVVGMVAGVNEFFQRVWEQVGNIWKGMDKRSRWLMVGGLVASLIFLFILVNQFSGIQYSPLFTRMQPEDAAEVIAVLKKEGIPFQLAEQGGTILVPEDKVYETRLDLASQGIPRGGVVGLELWDKTALTETDFDRRIKLLRSLQGELTRTLLSIDAIANARVHIVLPEESLFIEDQNPATASVLLALKPGATLKKSQIRGISHLVASSVEGLSPENVTIIDNRGNILSDLTATTTGPVDGGQVLKQLEVERSYEVDLQRSLQAMLERVFGLGRVVVRVNAKLDFDYQERKEKRNEPINGNKGVIVSEQIVTESQRGTGGAAGPAGVTANVPGYVASGPGGQSEYEKEDVIRNYELNTIEEYRVKALGTVQQMSVAVWIDGELEPAQRQKVEQMVASAAGLDRSRGDVIQVDSMQFASLAAPVTGEELGRRAGPGWDWRLPLLVGGMLLALGIAVRAMRRRREPQTPAAPMEAEAEGVEVAEVVERELSPEEKRRQRLRREIERVAEENPEEFARLVRIWLTEE